MVSFMVRKAGPPVKKAPATRRLSMAEEREGEERALKWSVAYGAPIALLAGWDPETGLWAKGSPVGDMLFDMRVSGLHVVAAAKRHDVRKVRELVGRGYDFMSDEEVSEDRLLIPPEERVFVDLALQVQFAEAEAEFGPVGVLFNAALESPRDALAYLSRRFPERWRDQPDLMRMVEQDPRDVAIHKLLQDPNTALEMAEYAHKIAAKAAAIDAADDLL